MKTYKITAQAFCLVTYYVDAESAEEAKTKFNAEPKKALQGKITSPIVTGGVSVSELHGPMWDSDYEMAQHNRAMVEASPIDEMRADYIKKYGEDHGVPERDDPNKVVESTNKRAETAAGAIISMITALVPLIATKEFINERHQALIAAMRALMTRETKER